MKIVSFNVNSVRLRIPHLQALVARDQPDVIGLQETKVTDDAFPVDDIKALGYDVVYCGQKTHYGVALMSRLPMSHVFYGFETDGEDAQKRLIGAEVALPSGEAVQVINGYFPQGESRDHPVKFPAKEQFYADLMHLLNSRFSNADHLAVLGDFNIAPIDNDIGIGADNAKRWLRTGKTSFLPEERTWWQRLTDWGLTDSYRHLYPDIDDRFSWFDYRSRGFERDPRRGLRIDHILTTAPLLKALTDSGIDYDTRAMTKPSDHCPIWSDFAL
ncbi:MAG TPA: exodeoxyribonuclease III [Gammaproteobacteria bacterium]|nr:exodeoxyribonuclease III [Gammaproteobacteria bacterium]